MAYHLVALARFFYCLPGFSLFRPREKIMKLLLEAHENGLVSDTYNERKKPKVPLSPVPKAAEGKFCAVKLSSDGF